MSRDLLDGIDLAIFDKDGTLIEFERMWSGWAERLASDLAEGLDPGGGAGAGDAAELAVRIHRSLGIDPATGRIDPHGLLAATPMARIRERLVASLVDGSLGRPRDPAVATRAVAAAWRAPDPVTLVRPVTDLHALFAALGERGIRIAVATSDDRDPTQRTLAALGVSASVEALACADDGRPVKPAPDMVLAICESLGVAPDRAAVIGDSPADLRMGRSAGAGRVIGVLTGVGEAASLGPLADAVIGSIAELV